MRLDDMRYGDALYWIAVIANADLSIEDGAIVFVPRSENTDDR